MQTRVVFVRQGTWGAATQEEADRYLDTIKSMIVRFTTSDQGGKEVPAATVETIENSDDARRRLERGDVDVLVFNSRSLIASARELKRQFPRVKIVVMTGLIPKEEVILVDKGWISSDVARRIFTSRL